HATGGEYTEHGDRQEGKQEDADDPSRGWITSGARSTASATRISRSRSRGGTATCGTAEARSAGWAYRGELATWDFAIYKYSTPKLLDAGDVFEPRDGRRSRRHGDGRLQPEIGVTNERISHCRDDIMRSSIE